jgi:catechol 2,3-dioxygenase-like lactoylglutathione lyase family enzyme
MKMTMRLNQIAIIVESADDSVAFYEGLFGVPRVGGTIFKGKVAAQVQALPDPCFVANWHMDDREFFQLELFEYQSPRSRAFARERRPWDIGYSRMAFEVNDPVAFHAKCASRSVPGLSAIKQINGKPHFALLDPTGVLLEVGPASRPIPAHVGARFAGVGMSVPSLDVALKSFRDAIGCPVLDWTPPDKGPLWDEPPASKRGVLLDAGTVWLEITEYAEPAPRPWPDGYRICDYGMMNVAFGFREASEIRATWQRMVQGGFNPNAELVSSAGQVIVGYLNDPQGFSVELLMARPWLDGVLGFRPETRVDKILNSIMMALA